MEELDYRAVHDGVHSTKYGRHIKLINNQIEINRKKKECPLKLKTQNFSVLNCSATYLMLSLSINDSSEILSKSFNNSRL